jgi:hypothetical protein
VYAGNAGGADLSAATIARRSTSLGSGVISIDTRAA